MIFFDIEIAKLSSIDTDDYDMMRSTYPDFDFMPEFNKIICISYYTSGAPKVESLTGDEKEIIEKFIEIAQSDILCGYNIKGFDIPFIIKRAIINGIKIPNSFKAFGKKPWDLVFYDDLYDIWKHIGTKSCKLDTLCSALEIPTPKDKMDGSQVDEYFRSGRIEEIREYCEKDVIACVKIRKRFMELNLI